MLTVVDTQTGFHPVNAFANLLKRLTGLPRYCVRQERVAAWGQCPAGSGWESLGLV